MKNLLYLITCILIASCVSNKENTIKVTTVKVERLTDSLYSRLPGKFFLIKDFVVWQDAFGIKGFLHILDKKTGKEILKFGDIGQGPLEFSTPEISFCNGKDIYLYDLNTKKQALFDLSKQNKKIKFIESFDNKAVTRKLYVDSLCQISLIPNNSDCIKITQKGKEKYLKNTIIEEKIKNGYDVFQGEIAYNYNSNKIIFAPYMFPYVAIYQKNNFGDFKLKQEIKKKTDYHIVNKNLMFHDNSLYGAFDMTLSKDYIVLLQFEKDNTKKRRSSIGRDFSKLPQTLFVYSYNGEIKKIINLKIPVLRIASNPDTNELFFIGVNPEFTIYKCKL